MDNNKMIGLSNEISLGLATTATAMIYTNHLFILGEVSPGAVFSVNHT